MRQYISCNFTISNVLVTMRKSIINNVDCLFVCLLVSLFVVVVIVVDVVVVVVVVVFVVLVEFLK